MMGGRVVFSIKYDGTSKAIQNHSMEARELATALMALDDLFKRANEMINGPDSKVSVVVKGSFKVGSFEILLEALQSFWQSTINLFNSKDYMAVKEILQIVLGGGILGGGSLIYAIRWLKNRKIARIEQAGDKSVIITEDQDRLETHEKIACIIEDDKTRKAVEDIVAPLSQHGEIHDLYIIKGDDVIEHIEQREAPVFAAPPREHKVELVEYETRYETTVELATINLKEDGKWRFRDVNSDVEFNATVEDEQFTRRVQQSKERFAKGDKLNVRLRECSGKRRDGRKHTQYFIEQVVEHIPFPEAPDMF